MFDCLEAPEQMRITVNERDIMKTIQKVKNKNFKLNIALPPQKQKKKTLVIDLDGVLIWSVF